VTILEMAHGLVFYALVTWALWGALVALYLRHRRQC
jgi:hypothetical protein